MYKKTILCLAFLLASPWASAKTLFCDGVTFLYGPDAGTINFTIELRTDEGILVMPTSAGELSVPIKLSSGEATYLGGTHSSDGRWFTANLNRFTGAFMMLQQNGDTWLTEFNGTCYERQPQF